MGDCEDKFEIVLTVRLYWSEGESESCPDGFTGNPV